jgi:hypothetical protein
MLRACSYLHRFGAVFVDELEANESATRAMIERFGVLRNSMFGSFWTFEANGAMDDLALLGGNTGLKPALACILVPQNQI